MPKLKTLSGKEVIEIFILLGFDVVSQRGSHVKLKRAQNETLTIPNHSALDRGTLRAIYRQGLRYISETELAPHFYTE